MEIDSIFLRVIVSDIVGKQEFYGSHNPYQGYDVILVMYDTTDLKTFDDLKTRWLTDIFINCNIDTQIIIVGNKRDEEKRVISYTEAKEFAESCLSQFYEISTKDNTCITLFDCICRDFLQRFVFYIFITITNSTVTFV